MVDYYGYYKWSTEAKKPLFFQGNAWFLDTSCRCDGCVSVSKESPPARVKYSVWDDLDPKKTPHIDDMDFFLLCSRRVPAFVLQERRWSKSLESLLSQDCNHIL